MKNCILYSLYWYHVPRSESIHKLWMFHVSVTFLEGNQKNMVDYTIRHHKRVVSETLWLNHQKLNIALYCRVYRPFLIGASIVLFHIVVSSHQDNQSWLSWSFTRWSCNRSPFCQWNRVIDPVWPQFESVEIYPGKRNPHVERDNQGCFSNLEKGKHAFLKEGTEVWRRLFLWMIRSYWAFEKSSWSKVLSLAWASATFQNKQTNWSWFRPTSLYACPGASREK